MATPHVDEGLRLRAPPSNLYGHPLTRGTARVEAGPPNDLLDQFRGAGHVQRGIVARRSLIAARHVDP